MTKYFFMQMSLVLDTLYIESVTAISLGEDLEKKKPTKYTQWNASFFHYNYFPLTFFSLYNPL